MHKAIVQSVSKTSKTFVLKSFFNILKAKYSQTSLSPTRWDFSKTSTYPSN